MNLSTIHVFDVLKRLNTRAAPLAALVILIAACIFAHSRARVSLEMLGTPLPAMKPTAIARLHFIEYVNANPWLVLPYLAVWVGALLWLQIRKSPRWSLRLTFLLLALPVFGYLWICFRVATQAHFWMS